MLPVLAALDIGLLVYDLYKVFNKDKTVKKGLEVIKTSGSFIDVTKQVGVSFKCNDVVLYPYDGVFKLRCKSKSIGDVIDAGFKLSALGSFLVNTLDKVKETEVKLPDVDKIVKEEEIDVNQDSQTLLDVMRLNNENLLKVLVPIANAFVASSVVQFSILPVIANEMQKMKEVQISSSVSFSVLLSQIVKQLSSISQVIDVSNVIKSEQIGQFTDMLQKVQEIKEALTDIDITIGSKQMSIDFAPNNNVAVDVDIDGLKSVLDKHLSKVAEAKELEKEHYEFMRTPVKYDLAADDVPEVSPREAIAMSESIKAHLNSQEASLSAEDLNLDDYDIDFDSLMQTLFRFKGIVADIQRMQGGDNGS